MKQKVEIEMPDKKLKIVAVTACPTGVAHTFMSAEALRKKAVELGHEIKVETRGSVGAQNALTDADIQNADLVILAVDIGVDLAPFAGKPIHQTSTGAALKQTQNVFEQAMDVYKNFDSSLNPTPSATQPAQSGGGRFAKKEKTGAYKHLMNGVSFMLPFVVAGGLLIALAFAFDIRAFDRPDIVFTALGQEIKVPNILNAIFQIGAANAFAMMVPILSGYIAYSIADRPGLAPGIVGGMLAGTTGAGFLGGIAAGFLAGFFVRWLRSVVKLPASLMSLLPTLILPFFGVLFIGLMMYYVIGWPVAIINAALTNWLAALQGSNAILLGLLMGGMMAVDMGGPVNKAAYVTATGLLADNIGGPMAAVMAAGMTPPIAMFLVTQFYKKEFTVEEQESGKAAGVLGLAFITEGAIPFAARDPFRVLLSCIIGSAVTGGIVMFFNITSAAPHGGVFAFLGISNIPLYALAIIIGSVLSAAIYIGLLMNKKEKAA